MSEIFVTLDDVTLRDFEIPERMPFPGKQMLGVKRLVGGVKVVDAMGVDYGPISWEGRFRGEDALDRARSIEAKMAAGKPVALFWSELAYTVVIEEFEPDFSFISEIPYRIRVEVIQNEAAPVTEGSEASVDQAVDTDLLSATNISAGIGDSVLGGLMSGLNSAVDLVSNFPLASSSVLSGILGPIGQVQGRLDELLDIGEAALFAAPGLDGSGLLAQIASVQQMVSVVDMTGYLGRMETNIGAIGIAGADIETVGGDLYRLATTVYGDPTEWTTIARANGLTDPILNGMQTIRLPPTPLRQDGLPL